MAYTPEISQPVIIPRGQSVVRTMRVYLAGSEATVTGTYALYDRDGASVATGTVTAGSVTITVPGTLELGAGAYEEWTLAAPSAVAGVIRRMVYVSRVLDSRWNLVSTLHLLAYRSWLALGYPAGSTDYENACTAATTEVLQALVARTEWSSPTALDLWDASRLSIPAFYRALGIIYRDAHAITGAPHMLAEAEALDAAYADWWTRAGISWSDDTGVGQDLLPATPGMVGFPPPGPAGGR